MALHRGRFSAHVNPPTLITEFYFSVSLPPPADPFADAIKGSDDDVQDGLVHIRIQQRNGRKTLTTVQGLSSEYDLKKIVRACKKVSGFPPRNFHRSFPHYPYSLLLHHYHHYHHRHHYLSSLLSPTFSPLSIILHRYAIRQNSKNRSDATTTYKQADVVLQVF